MVLKGTVGKPGDMKNSWWGEDNLRTTSAIRLCLAEEILYNVMLENFVIVL